MASSLKVHPSLVLIGAIIGVQLFGFIGIVIAAPIMASFKLFFTYVIKKLGDQDPFVDLDTQEPVEKSKWEIKLENTWAAVKQWVVNRWNQLFNKRSVSEENRSDDPDLKEE